MRYIAAYLLLQTGGNASPSAADIKKLLDTVGIETDDERLNKLISELEGKDINELISEGSSKLASVPAGGAAPAAAFRTPSEVGTPQEEVAAVMRWGSESSRVQAAVVSKAVAVTSTTDYFPPAPARVPSPPLVPADDEEKVDEEEEEEREFRAQEEEEESEEVDLASLLAEALVMLAELQVEDREKERMYKRAKEEARRAGKGELVEEELEGAMNVD
ncbi:hypothetical protein NMY22_g11866 [Coprinellus aureogranulatus]|nr:hypothetical protein NMY22_g11866 [Coprinellus aureogranulatus]